MKQLESLDGVINTMAGKYHVKPFVWRGIKFDSKAEGNRYEVLRAWKKEGRIVALHFHGIHFHLGKNDKGRQTIYTPDFTYLEDGVLIAEEVKGVRVRDFPVRAALFKTVFPEWTLRVIQV